jgi:hypothetical protein
MRSCFRQHRALSAAYLDQREHSKVCSFFKDREVQKSQFSAKVKNYQDDRRREKALTKIELCGFNQSHASNAGISQKAETAQ